MSAPDPRSLWARPFRGSEAVRAGLLTKRQLESSTWCRLFKDVYVHRAVELDHGIRCRAVALILPPGGAISGASAAFLLGADVLDADAAVEVTVSRRLRMPIHRGVRTRYSELRAGEVVLWNGIPTTSPLRTAFDIARRGVLEDAVVAVDALMRACGLRAEQIAAYAEDRGATLHGVGRLSGVLALAAHGAESPMETRLRLLLVRAGLPVPVLQHPVRDGNRRLIARLDLAYVQPRLGVEYDGESHWEPRAVRKDLKRQNALLALGWTMLRFTADDVCRSRSRVVAQVAAALAVPPPPLEADTTWRRYGKPLAAG